MEHASHFLSFMSKLGLVPNMGDEAMPTYWSDADNSFQNDYILTSVGMGVIPESVVLPVWPHSTKGYFQEPIMLDFSPAIKSQVVTSSRRTPMFDRARLQDADVQSHIKRELA